MGEKWQAKGQLHVLFDSAQRRVNAACCSEEKQVREGTAGGCSIHDCGACSQVAQGDLPANSGGLQCHRLAGCCGRESLLWGRQGVDSKQGCCVPLLPSAGYYRTHGRGVKNKEGGQAPGNLWARHKKLLNNNPSLQVPQLYSANSPRPSPEAKSQRPEA